MTMTRMQRRAIGVAMLMLLSGCAALKSKGGPKTPVVGQRVPILASEKSVEVDPSLAGVQVLLPPATANDAWAQSGGSADKSNGQLALAATPQRVWSAQIDGGGYVGVYSLNRAVEVALVELDERKQAERPADTVAVAHLAERRRGGGLGGAMLVEAA